MTTSQIKLNIKILLIAILFCGSFLMSKAYGHTVVVDDLHWCYPYNPGCPYAYISQKCIYDCGNEFPWDCPIPWTYQVVDKFEVTSATRVENFTSYPADLSTDSGNPAFAPIQYNTYLRTAVSGSRLYYESEWYRYFAYKSYYDVDLDKWGPWNETKYVKTPYALTYLLPQQKGLFRIKLAAGANDWQIIDKETPTYYFRTYDEAKEEPIIPQHGLLTEVRAGEILRLSVQGRGAPLEDYRYQFEVADANEWALKGDNTTGFFDYVVPSYDTQKPNWYYLSFYVGTTSKSDFWKGFIFDSTAGYWIEVLPATTPSITTESKDLHQGQVGKYYVVYVSNGVEMPDYFQLRATGGASPYRWEVESGLPPGMTVLSDGRMGGTPTTAGTYTFTVKVTDAANQSTSKTFSITILPPALSISTTILPQGAVNYNYYGEVLPFGGTPPYSWSIISGIWPPGVAPSFSDKLVFQGTPQSTGTYKFTARVTDAASQTKDKEFFITVNSALGISPDTLPNCVSGARCYIPFFPYGGTGTHLWKYSGTLPPGLELHTPGGYIDGTTNSPGAYNFTVILVDGLWAVAKDYVLYVANKLAITSIGSIYAAENTEFSEGLSATGGSNRYTWSFISGTLPEGVNFSPGGWIGGTPSLGTVGFYNFTVQVSDGVSPPVIKELTLNVLPELKITSSIFADGMVGTPFTYRITATGGTGRYDWSARNLPTWLTLDPVTGILTGVPTEPSSSYFIVLCTGVTGNPIGIGVYYDIYPSLQLGSASLTSSYGTAFGYDLNLMRQGGMPPFTWSVTSGGLPDGLSLDTSTGVISGIPTNIGTFNATIRVSDAQDQPATVSQQFDFVVKNGEMQHNTEHSSVTGCEHSSYTKTNSTTNIITGSIFHDQKLFSTKGSALGTSMQLFYKSIPLNNGPLGLGWDHSYNIFLTEGAGGEIIFQDGSGSKSLYTKSGTNYISPSGDTSVLVKNSDGTYTISYRDGVRKNFRSDRKVSSIVDRFLNSLSFEYTGEDLTGIVDSSGRKTIIGYDTAVTPHRISTVTDPSGNVYDFTYNASTLWKVINPAADPAVSTERGYWEYLYDTPYSGYLISKRDPNGNTSQYTYYTDHRMEKAIDPEGIDDPDGHTRTVAYPATTNRFRTSTMTEKDGGVWQYTYDSETGAMKEKTDPNGKVKKYSYYPNGNLKSKTEPTGTGTSLTTFYTYDSYGNLLTETEPVDLSEYSPPIDPETVEDPTSLATYSPPIKPAIRYAYDTGNYDRITSISDERTTPSLTTTFEYTSENGGEVVTATTTPGNFVTITKRYPDGSLKEHRDANGRFTTFTYYPDTPENVAAGHVGLLWTTTDAAGVTTTINQYDLNGNPKEVVLIDKNGVVIPVSTVMAYDALNQLTARIRKSTSTTPAFTDLITSYGYDNLGNIASVTDAESRRTAYEYNFNRQVTKITDAKQNDTILTYSGSGCGSCGAGVDKLIGVYDAKFSKNIPLENQPHTSYSYDKAGRLEYETDSLGNKLHYTYYDDGLIKEIFDATVATEKLLTRYTYNNRGQITDKDFSDGTYERYTYRPNGQLETAINHNISYSFDYYDNGRLKSVTDTTNGRIISYDQYDGIGQPKQVTVMKGAPEQRILSYNYDSANRPWEIISSAGTFTYSYDSLGRRDTVTFPSGAVADIDFDDLNRLISISHKTSGGSPIATFSYAEFDRVGNRKSISGSRNEVYTYDEIYRLSTVTSGKGEAFTYDAVGNRESGPSPSDSLYTHNAANQMTIGRVLGYSYDHFGNQTDKIVAGATDKSWVQTWDYQNRLTKVEKVKGSERRTISFKYDPLGRRISKEVTTVFDGVEKKQTWSYIYDGNNIAMEIFIDGTNPPVNTYYTQGPGIDEPLALERDGQFYYYHADGLGSIAAITNASQGVVQTYDYDSHGMVTPNTNFRNMYAYTGREWDAEAGLYYYRARYYDPMEGRFISKDPLRHKDGPNLYAYVNGNSINAVDPMGLEKLNLIDWAKDPDLYAAAESESDNGKGFLLTIYGHSTKQELAGGKALTFGGRTADQLAEVVKATGKWVHGMAIKLQGCRSGEGENSFAEQLSHKLNGAVVVGSDGPVWLNPFTNKDFDKPYPPVSLFNKVIINMPNMLLPGKWNVFK